MARDDKLLTKVLLGRSDSNIEFSDLCRLLKNLGFEERIRSSHHIYSKDGIPEILNIQPIGSKAKAYQVKQVRDLILRHHLGGISDE
ncbi:type II toxin-antitoxin system HicA family toxin [Leptonema illini]|jgi:predicted RNA binding protein YcfA (HicA-like mRNA interferase family)|uniref:YcfA family protein n=1 Tax=Leptonema illini DSM 21528 TaxID=929563 RepID=H2CI87_9LEPT|nr:type II toxin-antitoxin system HicA family toxin [Leptonema illini]EHQ04860.1 YcfA family protein [Leptonema illini DSM 21528]